MCKRMIGIALILIMLTSTSVFAIDVPPQDSASFRQEESMRYSDGEGRIYTNIDGEVYQVIEVTDENSFVVTDPALIAQLNGWSFGGATVYSPSYGHDLTRGSYTSFVNLALVDWSSPTLKRDGFANTLIKTSLTKTYNVTYFYYNEIDQVWRGIGVPSVNISNTTGRLFAHGSAGKGGIISRCIVTFVAMNPWNFSVTISGDNSYTSQPPLT